MSETTIIVEETVIVHGEQQVTPRQALLGKLGYWAVLAFLVAYIGVLSGAMFYFQFGLGELPCPLCITQRMGMMISSLGAVYILVYALQGALSSSRFMTGLGFAVLGALLGASMSTRQILLHIMPGDPGYGGAVLGLHLYTWALVSFVVVLVFVGVLLTFAKEFTPIAPRANWVRMLTRVIIWVFVFTVAANMVVVFVEEGFNWYLPDNPTSYLLFG